MSKIISASVLAADFANLADDCRAAIQAGVDWLHLDIMDNHYVPNLSFGLDVCQALRASNITAAMDVHLMVDNPDKYIEMFAVLKPEIFFIHPETCIDLNATIAAIKAQNCKVGLAYNPDQAVSLDADLLAAIDYILVMSVVPGFAGQKFIPETIVKIQQLKQHLLSINSQIKIAVDGGVKPDNIGQLAAADLFVLGSAIFASADYVATIESCRSAITD